MAIRADAVRPERRALATWLTTQARLFHRFRRDKSGSYVVVTGLTLPALLGIVGLATEAGLWCYTHQHMQSAADSAAISAATAYARGSTVGTEAKAVTASYGFVSGMDGVAVAVNRPPQSGTHLSSTGAVEVIVSQPQARLFSALFSSSPLLVSARAVAIGNAALGCVLALDASASGAVTVQGSASVILNGCSLFDNSSSSTALTVGGSGAVSALSVGVVGNISGVASITTSQGIETGIAPATDPYLGSSFPSFSGCDQRNFSAKKAVTIDPGVYCGGMTLNAGADVTLNPGVYYLDQGSLSVNGGATMTGTGVTFVFTSSTGNNYATSNINGGAVISLTAPTSGPAAGIVMFGDRSMPVGTAFKFEGGASQDITGALYLPKGAVKFAGGMNTGTSCTELIGDTLTFTGNSNFAINCTGTGTKPVGTGTSKLVE